jgi:signal transduction histidine kinase
MAAGSTIQLPTADELLARLDELEQQLHSMNSELANLHRLSVLGVLAAGIAHEINNLLTPVLSYTQLALAQPDDQALRTKALERTQAGIESVAQIVHAILGMTRGDEDQTVANVADVVDETLRCLGRDPAKDAVDIKIRIGPDTWVAINPVVLQQVLLNLVLNALKALHGRPGTITIATRESGSGRATITVADDGPGIPADVLPTLFDSPAEALTSQRKRHRLNTNVACTMNGTGLGLSICKQLVAGASGMIECVSSQKEGTTFTIVLPCVAKEMRKAG